MYILNMLKWGYQSDSLIHHSLEDSITAKLYDDLQKNLG